MFQAASKKELGAEHEDSENEEVKSGSQLWQTHLDPYKD